MTCHVFIAASVDGYSATPDGGVDWLDEPGEAVRPDGTPDDHGWPGFIERIDALVMGRGTFEKVLSFGEWPYEIPVVVMTSSLASGELIPDHLAGKAEVSALGPAELVAQLADRGWHELYVDGGKVITAFLAADLIGELTITTIPVVLGDGIPLFGRLPASTTLELVSSRALSNGMVQTHYRVA